MIDSSTNDEEQSAIPERAMNLPGHDNAEAMSMEPRDYRALLAMTRPLVVAKQPPLSLRVPIYRDEATSLKTDTCRAEFALKKGEILYPDWSKRRVTNDEALVTATALSQTSSNLKIRIYLGMS